MERLALVLEFDPEETVHMNQEAVAYLCRRLLEERIGAGDSVGNFLRDSGIKIRVSTVEVSGMGQNIGAGGSN